MRRSRNCRAARPSSARRGAAAAVAGRAQPAAPVAVAGGRAAGGRGGRAAGGRPAGNGRVADRAADARPTSGHDAPWSRLAEAALRGAGARGQRTPSSHAGPASPSLGCRAAGLATRSSTVAGRGGRLYWPGRDLRLWRGAGGRRRTSAARRIGARALDAGLPEPGDAGRPAARWHPLAGNAQRGAQLPAAREPSASPALSAPTPKRP